MQINKSVAGLILAIAVGAASRVAAQAPAAQVPGGASGGNSQSGRGPAPPPVFPNRPAADPVVVARGQQVFGGNCSFCHGPDARGGEGGPSLVRDQIVMDDKNGELITPIVQNGIADKGMPKFDLSAANISDIAAFIHSLGLGRGVAAVPVNPVVGNASAGEVYFNGAGKCNTCHSPTGDLKGVGSKYDPRTLQSKFLLPSGGRGAVATSVPPTTVTVTQPSGQKVEGTLDRIDDFSVSLTTADGTHRGFEREGDAPKVEVHDPLKAHKDLLRRYSDANIHDLTAFLVTLK